MSSRQLADAVWKDLAAFVLDHQDVWKHAVVERSGLPFSRIRILKRLSRSPLTVKQLAAAATVDAPAATVAVNDLEDRGLVARRTDPTNRRCKVVSLTVAGSDMLGMIDDVRNPAPEVLAELDDHDVATLRAILDKLSAR
ncbi:Transcriptional regulator SlyA [Mycolicibacterium vanbaalenii]|uniref:Transcriptional regulator SlyA n=1 Tax=Mycolicibacterium vanbaalenii TaxID=110539 RepID=A0A5S9QAN3_MYCVN|nr:MarR family transcriptional regulator [Mycolicibacterium vanbaalenii]CAA0114887.1 Transcriptional regulator SlyA [Mycolicibacterium vanbaalenii]